MKLWETLQTSVRLAVSDGIRHVFIVIHWTISKSSLSHNENMPYVVWKYLPYGSPQPPFYHNPYGVFRFVGSMLLSIINFIVPSFLTDGSVPYFQNNILFVFFFFCFYFYKNIIQYLIVWGCDCGRHHYYLYWRFPSYDILTLDWIFFSLYSTTWW